ncbi:MAG TPA: Uma2 family endonuclease [Planctomycetota bacterium]|nr:Uma2 family endonuclease [Planctomycetota bacterium]
MTDGANLTGEVPVARLDQLDRKAPLAEDLPPLESGDHLGADEYLRRYEAMPERVRAQLIDGIVYMSAAANFDHGRHHALVAAWLTLYELGTPGCELLLAPTVVLGKKDVPEPDGVLRIAPAFGGQTRTRARKLTGPPELAAEVADSSAAIDLHTKRTSYLRAGVLEYVVVVVRRCQVVWFVRDLDDYVPLAPDGRGVLRSRAFPGLWLDPRAIIEDDTALLQRVLERGLRSKEHRDFVRRIGKRARSRK